jgi:hypothetical protein
MEISIISPGADISVATGVAHISLLLILFLSYEYLVLQLSALYTLSLKFSY